MSGSGIQQMPTLESTGKLNGFFEEFSGAGSPLFLSCCFPPRILVQMRVFTLIQSAVPQTGLELFETTRDSEQLFVLSRERNSQTRNLAWLTCRQSS